MNPKEVDYDELFDWICLGWYKRCVYCLLDYLWSVLCHLCCYEEKNSHALRCESFRLQTQGLVGQIPDWGVATAD